MQKKDAKIKLEGELKKVRREKERCLREQDFQTAASFRDQEMFLAKQLRDLTGTALDEATGKTSRD